MPHTDRQDLPHFSGPQGVAGKLLQACQQELCSPSTVAGLLAEDPLLSARLLKFAPAAKVRSAAEAIPYCIGTLGGGGVRQPPALRGQPGG